MKDKDTELEQIAELLDSRDYLSPEAIHTTALIVMQRAFIALRECAFTDPHKVARIADALHTLPQVLKCGDHEIVREATVLAFHVVESPE